MVSKDKNTSTKISYYKDGLRTSDWGNPEIRFLKVTKFKDESDKEYFKLFAKCFKLQGEFKEGDVIISQNYPPDFSTYGLQYRTIGSFEGFKGFKKLSMRFFNEAQNIKDLKIEDAQKLSENLLKKIKQEIKETGKSLALSFNRVLKDFKPQQNLPTEIIKTMSELAFKK